MSRYTNLFCNDQFPQKTKSSILAYFNHHQKGKIILYGFHQTLGRALYKMVFQSPHSHFKHSKLGKKQSKIHRKSSKLQAYQILTKWQKRPWMTPQAPSM